MAADLSKALDQTRLQYIGRIPLLAPPVNPHFSRSREQCAQGADPAAAGQKISQLATAQRVGLERGCLRRCLFVTSRTIFRLAERQASSRGIKWCGTAILSPGGEQDSARKQSRPWLADPPGAGGRPLRRRREMRSVDGRQRLRGTAALQEALRRLDPAVFDELGLAA